MNRVVARLDPETAKVSAAMISSITTVSQEPPIREAADLMSQNCISHLTVLQDWNLCGFISAGDIFCGNSVNRNSLSTSWKIIFLKPDNQIS